jgi:toxoflavin biosynthesis protein ToxC
MCQFESAVAAASRSAASYPLRASSVYRQSAITRGGWFVMLCHVGPINGVAIDEDRYIATTGDDGRVIVREKTTGTPVNSLSRDSAADNYAFSRDGRYSVTSPNDRTARLWSVPYLLLKAVSADHGDDVTISVFHPVDELIVTASRNYFVRVYGFHANLIAKLESRRADDIVWLDWIHDGRELVA